MPKNLDKDLWLGCHRTVSHCGTSRKSRLKKSILSHPFQGFPFFSYPSSQREWTWKTTGSCTNFPTCTGNEHQKKRHRVGWTSHETSLFHPWCVPHPTPGVNGLGVALRQGTLQSTSGPRRAGMGSTAGGSYQPWEKMGIQAPFKQQEWGRKHNMLGIHIRNSYEMMIWQATLSGWWLSLLLWKMMEFVSWDDDIPIWMESHKIPWFQTTNQLCHIYS